MFDSWFTDKCMALVDDRGTALSGETLVAAEEALRQARQDKLKIWTDNLGYFHAKERRLFAPTMDLTYDGIHKLRVCGHPVNVKANFCSVCGSPAPGGWWRCGGCGQHIGNDSKSCPHCGHKQNVSARLDIVDGVWQKSAEIFAERFELSDVISRMGKGLNVQENQIALLLEGGSITDVLVPGFYPNALPEEDSAATRSIVMVDSSQFVLPFEVEDICLKDSLLATLHTTLTLRFDHKNASAFQQNLMKEAFYLTNEAVSASLAYEEIARRILSSLDGYVRDFCKKFDVMTLFKDPELRIQLDVFLCERLHDMLKDIGFQLVRLTQMDFESPVFEKFRKTAANVEEKRREIEFMQMADKLANDATRREAMNEYEMEDYMNQLAHEKGIKDELRKQEIQRLHLTFEHDLDDLQQNRQLARDARDLDAELEEKRKKLDAELAEANKRHADQLQQMLDTWSANLEAAKLETQIKAINREDDKKDQDLKIEKIKKYQEIDRDRKAFQNQQRIELLNAANGADLQALLFVEEDPEKRQALLQLNEQNLQMKATPELLLAAAAARGDTYASQTLSRMDEEQRNAIERSKQQNQEIYREMLHMSERMFQQATESLTKQQPGAVTNTTQIVK